MNKTLACNSANWRRRLSLVLVVALMLPLAAVTPAPLPAQAGKDKPKAHAGLLKLAQEHPNDTIRIIVQNDMTQMGRPGSDPEQAVKSKGGKVNKKLDLINGFAAELSGKEIEQLAKHSKVRWVSLDAPLFSTAMITSTMLDVFRIVAFDGNDGALDWSGDWQELGETDGPGTGGVKVANSTYCAAFRCLQIGGIAENIWGHGVVRQADLSHAISANLSFSYRRSSAFGTTGSVSVQVSGNGGESWTTLATIYLNASDPSQVAPSYDITPYIAANTQIRFIGSGITNRTLLIDNVQIEFTTPTNLPAPPAFSTVRDDFATVTYSGNDGTQNWTTGWIESDAQNGGSSSGNIGVVLNSASCALGGGNCLYVSNYHAGDNVYRMANLSGATSAILTLFRNNLLAGLNNNDSIVLEVSTNGGVWTTLRTWQDVNDDVGWTYERFDLTPYISPATRIRFRVATRADNGYMLFDDIQIQSTQLSNVYNRVIGADRLWEEPPYLDGQSVRVAVVDSGFADNTDFQAYGSGNSRIITSTNRVTNSVGTTDGYGHGTHVAGIIAGNGKGSNGARVGVAPGVDLINVKVSNDQGMSYSSDLVQGLEWIYNNRTVYNIRVVNISVNSAVAESYKTNAVDAACEMLWLNGIVVVVSSGNNGTSGGPSTVFPPANDPFVITVGATDDQGTLTLADDVVTSFSAYGTTPDGVAKPDLVAPGRNIISLLAGTNAAVYNAHVPNRVGTTLFRMSGTSMSAPMVSGAVALLLQDEPNLTPDQVKYRLKATARTTGWAYDPAKAGAGYLDAYAAVHGTSTEAANPGIPPHDLWVKMAVMAAYATYNGAPTNWGNVDWNSVDWNSVDWNSVDWNSVDWNCVDWNSVDWNSVDWNSVDWNSVDWNSDYWEP